MTEATESMNNVRSRSAMLCAVPALLILNLFSSAAEVRELVPRKVEPFALTQVRLLDGPFRHAQELDRQYLLSLDADRLLYAFRTNAGLPSLAEPLGGWEEPKCEVRGHSLGHFLSACAMMYASTGDEKLKQKGDHIVAELAKCQDKIGSGYLSAYPDDFIDRVEAGKRVWAPWYTLHKIYAGLLDMHVLCGNGQALEVLEKACAWIQSRTDKLSDEQMERMLGNEHGGMNDVLAELAAVTGNEKYLKLSQRFNHHAVLDPLAKREDRLTGLHANTQFPKILGAARQYELTGDRDLQTIATFFWDTVTKERSYVTGGNSDGEMFSPKEELSQHVGPSTTETCNTHNMLKITRRLFCWDPRAEYADYYERGLYNHILASQNPETGMVLYYLPLKTGVAKAFSSPNDSFWCCVGTGMENHAKYGDSIYFREGDRGLYVNLFIASELKWAERGVTVRQETKYPEEEATRLTFTCEQPVELTLHIRHPYWATAGFEVLVNGERQPAKEARTASEGAATDSPPGSYVRLTRPWKTGDYVEVQMPMTLRTEGFRDNPRKRAVMYGPLVLCAPIQPHQKLPTVVAEPAEISEHIEKVAGQSLTFQGSADIFRTVGQEAGRSLRLIPLYKEYQRPYVVYWDALSLDQWKAKQAEYEAEMAREKNLAARTVDQVQIGDEESEQAHQLQGEKTGAGVFGERRWRHAIDGGWFSYVLKVQPGQPQELRCTYWGSDVGNRVFDILVGQTKVATQKLERNRPDEFFDEVYRIPPELIEGKDKVTIRFQAHPGAWAGGVFGCRVLRAG